LPIFAAFISRRSNVRSQGTTFQNGVGQILHDQLDGTHAVVVAGDRQVNGVRVAVGIEQRNDLYTQLAGFLHGDLLAQRVNHQQGFGQALHGANAGEVTVDL
jgi:hypothetical protein